MGMRLHRRDPVVLGTPAAPAARGTCGSSIARTLRTAWWPRFAVAGVVLTVIGATLLSGAAQALVALGGSGGLRLCRYSGTAKKVLGPGSRT